MHQPRTGLLRESARIDQLSRASLAEREGIVAPEGDPIGTQQVHEVAQHQRIVHERVDVDPPQVFPRGHVVGNGAQVGPRFEAADDSPDRRRKGAAAVGECDAQGRQLLEHAAEDERADRERDFRGHPDEPGKPVARHPIFADHLPRVNEDGGAERCGRLEDREELRAVEIRSVDVRADLDTLEPELPDAALELPDREVGALHRDGSQTGETRRVRARDPGDVVVQAPREIERHLRVRPVAEHDRNCREHLHVDARGVAFGQPRLDIPGVALDLAEQGTVDDHARAAAAGRLMLESNEPFAARHVALAEVGQSLGKDVSMDVDLQQVRRPGRASPCRNACRFGSSRRRRICRRWGESPFRRYGE